MIFENLQYYILGEVITCFFSAILSFNIIITFSPYERRHRLFLYSCLGCFFASLFDIISVFCTSYPESYSLPACVVVTTLYYIFLPIVPVAMMGYTLELAFTYRKRVNALPIILVITYVIYLFIVIINTKTGWIFYFDAEKNYVYGPVKNITYVYTGICMAFIEITVLLNRKVMSGRLYSALCIYPVIVVLIMLIQLFYPELLLSGISSFSAILLVHMTIQGDMLDYDLITGLMTQHKLEKHVELKQYDGILYVLSINNLNNIQINMDVSSYNKMLFQIGKELSKRFERKSYFIASDKFAAISHSMDDVKRFAEEINNELAKLHLKYDLNIPMPLDFYSVAEEFSLGDKSFSSVMEIINNLLATAKANGDRSLQICDETVMMEMDRKRHVFDILKRELNVTSDQFLLNYQPIYSIKENKYMYMEALSRLQGTELGNISPAEFVPIAENKGLIEQLGNTAFEKVCKFIHDNKDTISAVSVNFSVYQIVNPGVVDMVMNTLNKYGLSPKNIIMEITESIFMDNFEIAYKNMVSLASRGIRFYLDDFGTGYSNLANVIGLPFSTIKMDRSFVLMIEHDERNFKLFSNLVSTFKEAGMNVLVEGVETQKQNELVIQAGADYIQGYLYSRPLPAENCVELMRQNTNSSNS